MAEPHVLAEISSEVRHMLSELFEAYDWHLSVWATLAGAVQGTVLVDDPADPGAALVAVNSRYFLACETSRADFIYAVSGYFDRQIYPAAKATGAVAYTLDYSPPALRGTLAAAFAEKYPVLVNRLYFECRRCDLDWRSSVPKGFAVVPVSRELLQESALCNLAQLIEEMQSERASVDEFLAASFGFCMVHGDEIAGWCLSEYNHDNRCEVGIETVAAYRRRGIGTILTAALLEEAFARGIERVGWHCWASNRASAATARKAGFRELGSYAPYFAWFDETANFAVNGNVHLWDGRPLDALPWYQRALADADAPAWIWWNAAAAAARLGSVDLALAYLAQAIRRGIANPGRIVDSDDWAGLRDSPRWPEILRGAGVR